ncbi:copper amine oxidase N-terminal domain-containing protein [Paenibacillus chitinolyticus]|uniref:copper amine oxidase N-terminal domain-containing protein n=1 Tax=Paenibacillus chitinolyticus TaxID=79263 RepID=UPI002DBDC9D2|nr:copper amine oxidase N-terminal domain-containing protein [Paenibacillus chitinolyticus]MEC0247390.1 copper amine oxidase N-terminal domain-containing protein [Paenibacillus chitinolyticus]
MLIKKLLKLSLLVFGVSISFPYQGHGSAESAGTNRIITLAIGNPQADIDGQKTVMPAAPILIKDTSMVPFRFLGELLGAEVTWENSTQTVILKGNDRKVTLSVGQPEANVNGVSTVLDQPAAIVNETTLVPLRFIAESLNRNVAYDNASKVITIVSKEETKPVAPTPEKEIPKKKLEHPTVDNISLKIGKIYKEECYNFECQNYKVRSVSSFVTDREDSVYMIDFDGYRFIKEPYLISKYNQKTGDNKKLETVVSLSSKFDIVYKDKKNIEEKLSYKEITPKKLFYDEKHEKLYLLATSDKTDIKVIIYEILPEVKLITYNSDDTMYDEENDIITTLDGIHFTYSNTWWGSIYSVEADKERSLTGVIPTDKKPRLVSLIKDDTIYLLDSVNKTIHKLRNDGRITEVAKVKMDEKIGAAAAKGKFFYAADKNGFYKIDLNGDVESYVKLSDLRYNGGLYEPKTKTYDRLVPGIISFNDLPPSSELEGHNGEVIVGPLELNFISEFITIDFAVDSQGNIIIHDNENKLLRRINVYGHE